MRFSLLPAALLVGSALLWSLPARAQMPDLRGERTNTTRNKRPSVRGAEQYDVIIPALMKKWKIPGASLAVMRDDRLVLSLSYGVADTKTEDPITSDSLFRLAGLSRPLTAATALLLVQSGKLSLDKPVFEILDPYPPFQDAKPDPRFAKITVRHLLQNSGGWDGGKSFEPGDRSAMIARLASQEAPADEGALIRYMMGQPLQFAPGSASAESAFGYLLLGKVIEKASGLPYEDAVRNLILQPLGIESFQLAQSRAVTRAPGEVNYHDYEGAPRVASLFESGKIVARPDGGFALESLDSSDGWIGTAKDYLKFVAAVDDLPDLPDGLSHETITQMTARPSYVAPDAQAYYGLGWNIHPLKNDDTTHAHWWHKGALPGSSALVVRADEGFSWVFLCNSRPKDGTTWDDELDTALWDAAKATNWPPIPQLSTSGPPENFTGPPENND